MKNLAFASVISVIFAAACSGPVGFIDYPTPGCESARKSHEHLLDEPGVVALGCGQCPNTTRDSLLVYVADDEAAQRLAPKLKDDRSDGVPCCALVAHFLAAPK